MAKEYGYGSAPDYNGKPVPATLAERIRQARLALDTVSSEARSLADNLCGSQPRDTRIADAKGDEHPSFFGLVEALVRESEDTAAAISAEISRIHGRVN